MKKRLLFLILVFSFSTSFAQEVVLKKVPYRPAPDELPPLKQATVNGIPSTSSFTGIPSGATPTSSPEVNEINKLKGTPINYFTGTPSVGLPIYTLTEGQLSVPIYLQYNANGMRAHDVAPWTGLNWNLSAGGSVTRVVKAFPDEGSLILQNPNSSTYSSRKGYYFDGPGGSAGFVENDTEADEFYLNIGGASYRFMYSYFSPTGFYFFPDQDIEVEMIYTQDPNYSDVHEIQGWRVIMPDGVKYTFGFGATEATAEAEIKFLQDNGLTSDGTEFRRFWRTNAVTSAWYLQKIESPYGHEINFDYYPSEYSFFRLADNEADVKCPSPSDIDKSINRVMVRTNTPRTIRSRGIKVQFNRTELSCFFNPVLQRVICNNIQAGEPREDIDTFLGTPKDESYSKKLVDIWVMDSIQNPLDTLKYKFNYGHFISVDSTHLPSGYSLSDVGRSHLRRLKLENVVYPDGTTHNFSYAFENAPTTFYGRLNYGVDHWGYLNGQTPNINATGLIAHDAFINTCTPNTSNRNTQPTFAQYGLLDTLTVSTGSQTIFRYESHQAENYKNGNSYIPIGGSRIKEVQEKDLISGTVTKRKFSYFFSSISNIDSSRSSGTLLLKPIYRFQDRLNNNKYFTNSALYPFLLGQSNNPFISYGQVQEHFYDGNDNFLGSSAYTFYPTFEGTTQQVLSDCTTDFPPVCTYDTVYYAENYRPNYIALTGQTDGIYVSNNIGATVSSKQFSYKSPLTGARVSGYRVIRFNGQSVNRNTLLRQQNLTSDEVRETTRNYDDTRQLSNTTFSKYKHQINSPKFLDGDHNFNKSTIQRDSNGDSLVTTNTYVGDFNFVERFETIETTCYDPEFDIYYDCDSLVYIGNIPPANTPERAIYEMRQKHMLSFPVEQYTTKDNKLVAAQYFEYKKFDELPAAMPYQLGRSLVSDSIGTANFKPIAYDSVARKILRDTSYYKINEATSYNPIGFPTASVGLFGDTSKVVYNTKQVLPLRTIANAGGVIEHETTAAYRSQLFGLAAQTGSNGLQTNYEYYPDGKTKLARDKDGYILSYAEYLDLQETGEGGLLPIATDSTFNRMVERVPRKAVTSLAPIDADSINVAISYLNGAAQGIQQINYRTSPTKKDIVGSSMNYDSFRRPLKQFLPFPADTASGKPVSNPISQASIFYEGDNSPFNEVKSYELSPLSRVIGSIGSGDNFRPQKEVNSRVKYGTYSSSKYLLTKEGKLIKRTLLLNAIYATESYDSDSNFVRAFYDNQGLILSKNTQFKGTPSRNDNYLITTYVYDEINRLVAVIPPALPISSFADSLDLLNSPYFEGIYFFKHDHRGRVVAKHTPGAGWSEVVYNQRNQPMLSQDARLKANNQWLFTKYDAFGRTAMSGVLDLDKSRDTLQKYFDSHLVAKQYEERSPLPIVGEGSGVRLYSNRSYPSQIIVPDSAVMSVYFYDDYSWLPTDTLQFNEYKTPKWDNVTGLTTGNQVRRLDTGEWLRSVQYYDDKNRIIQSQSENRFGAVNQTDMVTDFIGQLLEERTVYRRPQDSIPLIVGTAYTYDHAGRTLDAVHQINGNTEVLASYGYDEIGRLVKKSLNEARIDSIKRADSLNTGIQDIARKFIILEPGTVIDSSSVYLAKIAGGLQNVTYSYDIRGNLRCINCDSTKNLDSTKVFAMKLDYFQDGRYYNGVLSKQTWYSQNDSTARSYTYDYDKANRLTKGDYSGKSTEDHSLPSITYDANGNVNNLKRNGQIDSTSFGLVDDLQYTYQGYTNRLNAIDDSSLDTLGFVNISGVQDFSYYDDGSQKTDANKGITDITYNFLGLVERIDFGEDKRIEHTFTADGQKLRTKFIDGGTTLTKDYVGDLIYINDTLRSIWHDEGRVILDPKFIYTSWSDTLGNQYVDSAFVLNAQYQYFINDHQGSTRVVFQELNDTLVIAQTIQYGVTGDIISTDSTGQNLLTHLYQGKEWLDGFGYDFVTRTYDPYSMRFLQVDGADQFASGYVGMGNMPNIGVDPDGQWVHIAIGAVVGGGVNLWRNWDAVANTKGGTWSKIAKGAGFFGLGAAEGAFIAAVPASGFASVATSVAGRALLSGTVKSIGNVALGGNPDQLNPTSIVTDAAVIGLTAGTFSGIGSVFKGGSFWKGLGPRAEATGLITNEVTDEAGNVLSSKMTGKVYTNQSLSESAKQVSGLADDVIKVPYKRIDPNSSAGWKSLDGMDERHFFSKIVDNYMSDASKFTIKGGDNIHRSLYQMKGSLRGESGIFEWIVETGGNTTHRVFIPGGKVTGIPNKW